MIMRRVGVVMDGIYCKWNGMIRFSREEKRRVDKE